MTKQASRRHPPIQQIKAMISSLPIYTTASTSSLSTCCKVHVDSGKESSFV